MGGAAGEIWTKEAVAERKAMIVAAGLTWSVVESIPVHEEIKWGGPNREQYIANYKESMRNCAASGIDTFCYNFMYVHPQKSIAESRLYIVALTLICAFLPPFPIQPQSTDVCGP